MQKRHVLRLQAVNTSVGTVSTDSRDFKRLKSYVRTNEGIIPDYVDYLYLSLRVRHFTIFFEHEICDNIAYTLVYSKLLPHVLTIKHALNYKSEHNFESHLKGDHVLDDAHN